jgi:hypothetical protein
MATLHRSRDGRIVLAVKGDPAEVLARCAHRLAASGAVALDAAPRRGRRDLRRGCKPGDPVRDHGACGAQPCRRHPRRAHPAVDHGDPARRASRAPAPHGRHPGPQQARARRWPAATALALAVAGTIASTIGFLPPWGFQRAGYDPAYGSGPLATVIQDVLSIAVHLGFVRLVVA